MTPWKFVKGGLNHLDMLRRLLVFGPENARYLRRIRNSGLFDREFYRKQHPQLLAAFLRHPERHYVAFGEQAGFYPMPDFSPHAYLRRNPDVVDSGLPPFLHYIEHGRAQARKTRDPAPATAGQAPSQAAETVPVPDVPPLRPSAEVAVAVHVYYPELWYEIERSLRNVDIDFDLYVTVTHLGAASEETTESIAQSIRRQWPRAVVVPMPNHGRDIFPWLHLVNSGALSQYRCICKLHTKRSPHLRDGDQWRRRMIESILPAGTTGELVERFMRDRRAGVLVVHGQHLAGKRWWGANQARVAELLARVGIQPDPEALNFPAGSIYWLKQEVVHAIAEMQLKAGDCETEQGATDGTTAHAFERALGYLVAEAGLEIRETRAA